ncbi:MAG: PadR family transcriptional regulator [Clostridia bacterium]
MIISSDILRGHTETIILRQLLDKDNYGYEISKAMTDTSNNMLEVKDATIYTAFRRMELDGLISSYWGDGDLGARRKYYSITEKGTRFYEHKKQEWLQTIKILNDLIIGGQKND